MDLKYIGKYCGTFKMRSLGHGTVGIRMPAELEGKDYAIYVQASGKIVLIPLSVMDAVDSY